MNDDTRAIDYGGKGLMTMRVIYFTSPSFLDPALHLVRELSQLVELHLVLEITPEGWLNGPFDIPRLPLPSGIVPAAAVLNDRFPPRIQEHWRDVASFNFIVHNCRRAVHPAAWFVSHQAFRFMRDLRPSVIHFDDVSLRQAWAIRDLGNLPIVLAIHDPEPHSGEHNWRRTLTWKLTLGRVREFILHNHGATTTFAQQNRIAPNRIHAVPLGVYNMYREWAAGGEADLLPTNATVLFFGRVSPYKGLESLYQAAPRVAGAVPGVHFIVAGRRVPGYSPPSPPPLPNGGRIEVIDEYIPNQRLAELFQQATVVVCPYTDATQSGVVLTAYAFGKPVVATSVGGLPEYVKTGETGLLVPPRDPEALATALTSILANDGLRSQIKAGIARSAKGELAWKVIARKTVEVYEGIS